MLDETEALLGPLVQALSAQRVASDHASGFAPLALDAAAVDPGQLRDVRARLVQLLAAYDPIAVEVWRENSALLKSAFGPHYRPIAYALENYDFDGALDALQKTVGQEA